MKIVNQKAACSRLTIPVVLALSVASLFLTTGDEPAASVSQSYVYDIAGRLTQVTYSDGRTITYTYDAMGNLLSTELTKKDKIFFDGFEQLAFLDFFRRGE